MLILYNKAARKNLSKPKEAAMVSRATFYGYVERT